MTQQAIVELVDCAAAQNLPLPDMGVLGQTENPPVAFPIETFGGFWQNWLLITAENASAPVDYVAGGLLAATSALIGNARRISPWRGWEEPAALWIANVGRPSSSKSPATDVILDLLRELESDFVAQHEQSIREYETAKEKSIVKQEVWKTEVKTANKLNTPPPLKPLDAMEIDEPVMPRIIVNDTSIEKLAQLLSGNKKGLLLYRDELSGWLGNFDRYSGKDGERGFWIECFGARSFTVDRVKHKKPIHIANLHISILGGIQPDPLSKLLHEKDDGLAARFLYLWPSPLPPKRPNQAVQTPAILNVFRRLLQLPMNENGGKFEPKIISISNEGIQLLDTWRKQHYQESQHVTGVLESHYGKLPGILLRLALCLEYMWWAVSNNPEPAEVSLEAMTVAVVLVDGYFKPMAQRVMIDTSTPVLERNVTRLARWILKNKPELINAREIARAAKLPGLRTAEKVNAAITELVEANWLSEMPHTAANRPKKDYRVNPQLYKNQDYK